MRLNKMKILSVIVGLMVLLMVPMVSGIGVNVGNEASGHLIITDVDVRVDGKSDKNLKDGDKISEEARPGATVEFIIEVGNNFTNDDDVEIEDIEITVTIEEIDDGGDLEEESKQFDLKDNKDDKIKIEFEIPLEVDEDTYDVLIDIQGDTKDNGSQEVTMDLELEVEKKDNEVRFLRNSMTPSEIKCSRTVQLSSSVINTGSGDEDDVTLEVTSTELGVSFRETFDLSDDPFDDDSKFRKTFTFTVGQEVGQGIYPIQSVVTFDDGSDTETETVDLTVTKCELFDKEEEEDTEEVVVVTAPEVPDTTQDSTAETVSNPTLPVTEEKSLFQSNGFLAVLIAGEVLLVIIAILIVIAVVRKRD
jgi:hypothetical protein